MRSWWGGRQGGGDDDSGDDEYRSKHGTRGNAAGKSHANEPFGGKWFDRMNEPVGKEFAAKTYPNARDHSDGVPATRS